MSSFSSNFHPFLSRRSPIACAAIFPHPIARLRISQRLSLLREIVRTTRRRGPRYLILGLLQRESMLISMSKLKGWAVFHGAIWEELSERGRLRNDNIHRLCEDMREPKKALLCSGWYPTSLNACFRERASNLHLRCMPLPSHKVFLSIFSPFLLPNQAASQIFKRKACPQWPKGFGRCLLLISGKFGRAF